MEDTTISIIAIFIATILMFIVPLLLIADRADDIAQLTAQTVTSKFVDDVIKSGKIKRDDYEDFRSMLNTTGNTYDIELELKVLDPNTSKQYTVDTGNIGKNTYYSIFTSQIENKLLNSDMILKEGDIFSITVKNNSLTLSQSVKNIYYKLKGENLHIIAATASGIVAINGAI